MSLIQADHSCWLLAARAHLTTTGPTCTVSGSRAALAKLKKVRRKQTVQLAGCTQDRHHCPAAHLQLHKSRGYILVLRGAWLADPLSLHEDL